MAINVFGIPRTTAVQVSTPARALSKPGDRESPDAYDLELMWDANDDNQPGAPTVALRRLPLRSARCLSGPT